MRNVVVAVLGSSALLAACTKKNYFECEADPGVPKLIRSARQN